MEMPRNRFKHLIASGDRVPPGGRRVFVSAVTAEGTGPDIALRIGRAHEWIAKLRGAMPAS